MPPATVVRRRRAAVLAVAGAAFIGGVSLGAGAGDDERRAAGGDRGSARAGDVLPRTDADAGAGRPPQPPAAGRQARRAALRGHDGADLRAPRAAPRLGLGRDPVQAQHRLAAAAAGAHEGPARRGQGRRRAADRLHRSGGRRHPQRRLGASRGRAGAAGAGARRPRRRAGAAPGGHQRDARAGRRRALGLGHRARRPRVLDRPREGRGRDQGRGRRLARRRRRGHRQALPGPRRRDDEHRLRLGHDPPAVRRRTPTWRRSAPRSRRRCR